VTNGKHQWVIENKMFFSLLALRRVQIKRPDPRHAVQNVRERYRRGQFGRVTEHKCATTRTNKETSIRKHYPPDVGTSKKFGCSCALDLDGFFMLVGFMQSLKFVSRFCILGPNK
jgi:hypothetical protein